MFHHLKKDFWHCLNCLSFSEDLKHSELIKGKPKIEIVKNLKQQSLI
jgi:hypothetical protein